MEHTVILNIVTLTAVIFKLVLRAMWSCLELNHHDRRHYFQNREEDDNIVVSNICFLESKDCWFDGGDK